MKHTRPVKYQTSCCALCHMTADDTTPIAEMQHFIDITKKESEYHWNTNDRRSGERAIFTIVSPGENILENNLKKLGFTQITTFSRRTGYPKTGDLKMYFLKW